MQPENQPVSAGPAPAAFALSESAAARINAIKAQDGKPQLRFRVMVKGGGCSGFQYEFNLEENPPAPEDTIVSRDGAEVLIDDVSLGLLAGSTLEYTEDLSHAGFAIKNPNATARCGCGNSFAL